MTKTFAATALIVSAFCFASVLARKDPVDKFFVEGKIYCDPCHFAFESRLSQPLEGVNITLKCVNELDNKNVTYVKDDKTDANGMYSIPVYGDHEEDICVVVVDTPTEGKCREAMPFKSDRIILTKNMGVSSLERYVNPLGFMTQTIDPECTVVAQELELDTLYISD